MKVFLWILAGIFALLLLVSILLYIPAVQKFAVSKVESVVAAATGMKLSVGRFRLKIPLRVQVDNTILVTSAGDTLLKFDKLRTDIALWALMTGELRSPAISLENASATYRDTVSAMLLDARIDYIKLKGARLRLKNSTVKLLRAEIRGADVVMRQGEGAESDTIQADTTASTPWSFIVRRLELSDVKFGMTTTTNVTEIAAELPEGSLRRGSLDTETRSVEVGRICLRRGVYSYLTGSAADKKETIDAEPDAPADKKETIDAEPDAPADTISWRVSLAKLELIDNAAAYGSLTETPAYGLDPQHIRVDTIRLLVENVLYEGGDISASLRHLSLRERSGLVVREGSGDFAMTGEGISINSFELATANSDIKTDLSVGAGVTKMGSSTPLRADISANIGTGDLFLLFPFDASAKRALRGKSIALDGGFSGTLSDISINKLAVTMPGHIEFNAQGNVRSVTAVDRLNGRLSFDGSLRNLGFAKGFIADTALKRRIGLPKKMTFAGDISFTPKTYELPRFTLTADKGRLSIDARLDMREQSYRADVDVIDFPLHAFLPNDSLGMATLNLGFEGRGLDPSTNMDATVALAVDRLDYKSYDFGRLTLNGSICGGDIAANVDSNSDALVFTLGVDGKISPEKYSAHLTADMGKVDLYGMKLSPSALAVTTTMDINVSAAPHPARIHFALDAVLDSTILHFGNNTQRIALTTVKALSHSAQTMANINSGDLKVDFSSPMALDSLIVGLNSVAGVLGEQIKDRSIRMESVQKALPDLKLSVAAGRGNIVRDMALANGIDFRSVTLDLSTTDSEPLRGGVELIGLHTGTLTLDTVNLWARRGGEKLNYALRLANRPGNVESLALIYLYGNISENRAKLNILQRNRAESVGYRFGFEAQLLDSMVRAVMIPTAPTLGYQQWSVNEGNYIDYHFDNKLYADLRLQGVDKHIILESAKMDRIPQGALRLDMAGVDISNILELLPTAPSVGGIVWSDLRFGLHHGLIASVGNLGVKDLMYEQRRVADIDAFVDFQSDSTGLMSLDSHVELDSHRALIAKGTYSTAEGGYMDLDVAIPEIPLAAANAFIPRGVASLAGNLDGSFTLKGTPLALLVNGEAGFSGGKIAVDMTGTSYGISQERITVYDALLNFNGLGIVAPNNRKLRIDGSLDMRKLSDMRVDMALLASDFQAINSKHIGGSQVYGQAGIDVNLTAKGALNALSVRGDVNLKGNTDVTYIMRDRLESVSDRQQDVVSFMVFADSLFMQTYVPVKNLRPASSVDMVVGVNIEEGLQATVNLDEQGENRIELIGGGVLGYSMNSQGDMRLSGRYTLSGGTVIYKPPLISQKIFAVKEGSYVEWVGEAAAPSFNVKGTQTMKVDVDTGSGAESVNFDITISIEGSLETMQLTFDVASAGNATIQNQLIAMAPEQRMQQALSLLLYNQYSGPGVTTQGSKSVVQDQLNSFISKEVNQWARNNLKGVDLSVGIDSKGEGVGKHTDYSYSVSKSLFSDRVKVSIGGSVRSDADKRNFKDNLVDDISLEYRLAKRDNMFLKVYRYNTSKTIFEGAVTETGVGFLMRKKMNRVGDLFRLNNNRERRELRRKKRNEKRVSSGVSEE